MKRPFEVAPETFILPSSLPVPLPGFGHIPINSYLIKSREPVLIDAGMAIEKEEWLKALESLIDPKELKWIWITHDDADHTGNIQDVLRMAPDAKIVTNIIGVARMETAWPIRLDQCYLMKQGETLDVGDRTLTAVRPPVFDSPATMGAYDDKSKAYISADCFGAFVPEPVEDADDVPQDALVQGFGMFNTANHPWIHLVDNSKFESVLNVIREMNPQTILSCHLPPAHGRTDEFLKALAALPDSDPFLGFNQAEVDEIMAQVNAGQAPDAHGS